MAKMSATPIALSYVVFVSDATVAAAAQAANPSGLYMSPRTAATTYGVPIVGIDTPFTIPGPPGYILNFDYVGSKLVYGSWPLALTSASGFFDPTFVWPGIGTYDPQDYFWNGAIVTLGGANLPSPDLIANIPNRRWVQGYESLHGGNASGIPSACNRFSSRTADGMGWPVQAAMGQITVNIAPPTATRDSWERFYIKVRALPVGDELPLWSTSNTVEGTAAAFLHLNTSGQLIARNVGNATYPGTTMGTTTALTLDRWYKIDIFLRYPNATTGGFFKLYIGGSLIINYTTNPATVGSGTGMSRSGSVQASSTTGVARTTAATAYAVDFDDWIGADLPVDTNGSVSTNSPDFKAGSHIRLMVPSGFSSLHNGAWTGDWRGLWLFGGGGSNLSTATVSATAAVTTLAPGNPQGGAIALSVNQNSITAIAGNATIGARVGSTTYNGPPTSFGSNIFYGNVFNIGVGSQIGTYNPIDLFFIRSASAGTHNLSFLVGQAEYMGFWGDEDRPPGSHPEVIPVTYTGLHNAPYPDSPEAMALFRPLGTVATWAGTWAGNNVGQDISTPVPLHWIFHRPASGSTGGGGRWWSSMAGAHAGTDLLFAGPNMAGVFPLAGNPSPGFRVHGASANINQTGQTYYVVGFSDPAARFMLNMALHWPSNPAQFPQPNGINNNLWDPAFTPDGSLLFIEDGGSSSSGFKARDPGHTTDQASPLASGIGTQAGMLSTSTGVVVSKTGLHGSLYYQTTISLWRGTDNGGNSGALAVVTYVGNGLAARNITVPLNNNSPMFALGVPHTASPTSYFRDPYHTALDSSAMGGSGVVQTGIIGGGINYVTVGTSLNANGTTYGLFVMAGCPKSGGFSDPGLCFPVIPAVTPGPLPAPPSPTPPAPPGPGLPTAPPVPTVSSPALGPCMTCTTLTDAITLLSLRLHDQGLVHWTAAELTRYLLEAVRTWNALTSSDTDQGTFNTTTGLPFYDLPTVLPTLRGYNLKDTDLITDTEYALMEAINVTAWAGTAQFVLTDVVKALEHRRDRFLYETGMVVRRFVQSDPTPAADGRFPVDASIMNIRRLAYIPASGVPYPLYRDDEWALQSYLRTWPALGTVPLTRQPMVYSVGVTPQGPPISIQIAPPLSAGGTLDFIVISRAGVGGQTTPCLDPTVGIFMGIPDDWCWVIKFGALAELLNKQGVTYDPQRAGYCESRWQHGIQMASKAAVTLAARVNGQPIQVDNLSAADQFQRTWQQLMTTPTQGFLTGTNLLALSPVPNSALHTVTLDVVRNAIVPVVGTDCLGAEAQILDGILDYAEHLAMFKEGPEQLKESMDLLDRFFRMCGTTLSIKWASVPNSPAITSQSNRDEAQLPRTMVDPPSPVTSQSGSGSGSQS